MVFGAYQGALFGAVISLLLAGWIRPGPQSVSVLLANGAFLVLFNVLPILWLKYLAPLPVSSRGLYASLGISKREREVAECLAEGLTNQEIADRLYISLATVKDHNHNLFRKCGVRNRLELVNLLKQ
jgi:DNA-binding CsgD family transcriptional regulator